MKIFGWFVLFCLGWSVINLVAYRIKPLMKVGFSLPMGMGIHAFTTVFFDVIGVPVNDLQLLLSTYGILCLIFSGLNILIYKPYRDIWARLRAFRFKSFLPINLGWIFFACCMAYMLYSMVAKTLFWPVFIYDSIHGYDFIARLLVIEGTLNSSIFNPDFPMYSVRSLYPPIVPVNMGFAYLLGFESPEIVSGLYYMSIAISFYALLREYNSHLAAAFFTFVLITIPEFAAWSATSSPNPPTAYYVSIGALSIYHWFRNNQQAYFITGTLFMAMAVWVRSEAVVFIAAVGCLVFLKTFKERKFLYPVLFVTVCATAFLSWQLFLDHVLHVSGSQPIVRHLFWDGGKLMRVLQKVKVVTFNVNYYGLTVYFFLLLLFFNLINIVKHKDALVLIALIFTCWVLYIFLFYQIDTDYLVDKTTWIENGYKRGLFYFFPMMLFYCAVNRISLTVFNKYFRI